MMVLHLLSSKIAMIVQETLTTPKQLNLVHALRELPEQDPLELPRNHPKTGPN